MGGSEHLFATFPSQSSTTAACDSKDIKYSNIHKKQAYIRFTRPEPLLKSGAYCYNKWNLPRVNKVACAINNLTHWVKSTSYFYACFDRKFANVFWVQVLYTFQFCYTWQTLNSWDCYTGLLVPYPKYFQAHQEFRYKRGRKSTLLITNINCFKIKASHSMKRRAQS